MRNAVYQSCGSGFVDIISKAAALVGIETESVQILNISREREWRMDRTLYLSILSFTNTTVVPKVMSNNFLYSNMLYY